MGNVSQRKKRDVKNIGKNQPQERRFGWKIQLPASGTMPLNVLLLLNTEPNKRSILNVPRYHIKIASESRIQTVTMFQDKSAKISHIKTVKITKGNDVHLSRNVKITQYKNVETSIKRPQDRSQNRSLFVYVATVVLLIMSMIKKISEGRMFLMSEPLMNMILRMMPKLLPSVNKRKKLILDYSSRKKMSKTLLRKSLTKKKETKKKQMMMLFPLDDRI